MPYARRRFSRARRAPYSRRRTATSRYRSSRPMVSRRKYSKKRPVTLGTVFPRQLYQKLSYADVWDLTMAGGGGTYGIQLFRPTDLHDMDYTGVGGTATGFATMITAYKYWSVKAYKVKLHIINTSDTAPMCGIINVGEDFAMPATGTAVQQELMENNNGRYVMLSHKGSPGSVKDIKMYIKPSSVIGDTYKDLDYRGSGANNPSKWLYAAVMIADQTGGVVASTVRVAAKVTAYVKWSQRIFPATD